MSNRIRPIFMSVSTSVCGMLPLILFPGAGSELYRGLGSVVVGGLIVSTVFTLFLVPALFSLVLEARDNITARLRRPADTPPCGSARSVGEGLVPSRGRLRASRAQLADDLDEWRAHLGREAERVGVLLTAAEGHVRIAAQRVGACAMPGGPFIEAFRSVLDRRSNPFSRRWRLGLRKLRLKIESLPSLFSSRRRPTDESARASLDDVEKAELERAWPALWEGLSRDLGSEGRVGARAEVSDDIRAALDRDLDEARAAASRTRGSEALQASSMDLEAFQSVCEVLVEEGIAERGRDWDIQAAADVATLAPIAIATAVIIKTGGLGSDVGVAGGAALSSYLFDKYSHLLGTRITNEASRRWAEQRTGEVAPVLLSSVLAESSSLLSERRDADRRLSEELRTLADEIRP